MAHSEIFISKCIFDPHFVAHFSFFKTKQPKIREAKRKSFQFEQCTYYKRLFLFYFWLWAHYFVLSFTTTTKNIWSQRIYLLNAFQHGQKKLIWNLTNRNFIVNAFQIKWKMIHLCECECECVCVSYELLYFIVAFSIYWFPNIWCQIMRLAWKQRPLWELDLTHWFIDSKKDFRAYFCSKFWITFYEQYNFFSRLLAPHLSNTRVKFIMGSKNLFSSSFRKYNEKISIFFAIVSYWMTETRETEWEDVGST